MYFCWYRSFYLPTMTQRKEAESQSSFTNVYFTLLLGKLSSASLNSVMLAQCARSWVRSMEIRDPITHSLYLQIASTMKQGGAKNFHFSRDFMASYFQGNEFDVHYCFSIRDGIQSCCHQCSLPPAPQSFFSNLSQENWVRAKIHGLSSYPKLHTQGLGRTAAITRGNSLILQNRRKAQRR